MIALGDMYAKPYNQVLAQYGVGPLDGMQPEQEYNIDCLVRKRFATRIRKPRVSPTTINGAIEQMLRNEEAKRKAAEFQKVIEKWDSPSYMQGFFNITLTNSDSCYACLLSTASPLEQLCNNWIGME